MTDGNTVKGTNKINSGASEFNAIEFMINQALNGQIHTAIPVKITGVSGAYVDALPLVTQIDGYNEAVEPVKLFHLPFFRYHAGIAAVIVDPVPGDIGLAVFAQSDSTNVIQGTDKPQQPGSFRKFSMSDGFYIGGFLNRVPSVFIQCDQDGSIIVTAPNQVNINSPLVNISGKVNVASDATIGGVSFLEHVHACPHGGSTSSPY